MAAPAIVDWSGTDIDLNTVEDHLTDLWAELSDGKSLAGAVRTSIFNLVVYCADDEEADRVCTSLDQLSLQPSRTVILVADRLCPRSCIDASASIRCFGAAEGRPPLCTERVVVSARGRAASHLDSIVMPLLMPELPTYLWWPGQPPFGHRVFHRLLLVADQLVVDSAQFESPGDGLANLARLGTGRQGISDFNWGRLTAWRELTAQFFDGPTWEPYTWGMRSVKLTFGSGGDDFRQVTSGTLLLLGWISSHLGWEPETTLDTIATRDVTLAVLQGERTIPIDLQFRDHGTQSAGKLVGIEIVSQPRGEPPARFSIERLNDLDHVHVHMEIHGGINIDRVVPLSISSQIELLADELEAAGHNVQYDRVVMTASRIAGREIWIPA